MINADKGRAAGLYTGSDHNLIPLSPDQVLLTYRVVEFEIDPMQLQLPAVIAQGFMEFFFAWNALGQVEMATDFSPGVE